ncbi:MAG: D-aminoacylase [Ruminococcaceae bacterium]|nr:D-aminoacylase [Oscillospiraceae bacterium]
MLDLIIRGGLIADGTGQTAYHADIGVKDGKIARIEPEIAEKAAREIDAQGLVVAPGFLDIHSHSDLMPIAEWLPESKLYQGVTFELVGNCGGAPVPTIHDGAGTLSRYAAGKLGFPADGSFIGTETYARAAADHGHSTNYGTLVGHSNLRSCVVGLDNRDPSEAELAAMAELLDRELTDGAFGMSLGLIYPPSAFAGTPELDAMAEVVAKHDGVVSVHMRNEGKRVFEALEEMIGVARRTGVHVEISHFKIMTKSLWGQSARLLEMVDNARAEGLRIDCDQYPYDASYTGLSALVPKWAHSGGREALLERVKNPEGTLAEELLAELESRGGIHRVMIANTHGRYPEWEGLMIADMMEKFGMSALDTVRELLIRNEGSCSGIYFAQYEQDVERILARPDIAVGSDGYNYSYDPDINKLTRPHPRSFATFPHALELMRDKKLLPLEAAVRKMTGVPAATLGITDRGILEAGKAADITIFDWNTVCQTGDYLNPYSRPRGIEKVIVAGQVIVEDGQITDARPGQILRHGR